MTWRSTHRVEDERLAGMVELATEKPLALSDGSRGVVAIATVPRTDLKLGSRHSPAGTPLCGVCAHSLPPDDHPR